MAAPLSDETKVLLKVLEDGQWHPLEDVLVRIAATVPPGRAVRRYDTREAARTEKRGPRTTPELSESDKIASGQRSLATRAYNAAKKNLIEVTDMPQGRMVRRRASARVAEGDVADSDTPAVAAAVTEVDSPEAPTSTDIAAEPSTQDAGTPQPQADHSRVCDMCGLWVVNTVQHDEFHAQQAEQEAPAAAAFFSEEQVRAIVADEVREALDEFRKIMQGWLIHRFAAVEELLPDQAPQLAKAAERSRRFRRW